VVLFELYPRKVVLEPGDYAEVIGGVAAFLRFLETEGLWAGDESSEELASLLVEQAGACFDVVMADESRWGPGKRLFSGAAAQGVDNGVQGQLDEYVRTLNSPRTPSGTSDWAPARLAPAAGRRAGPPGGAAGGRGGVDAVAVGPGPGRNVGEGRRLPDKGNLKLGSGTLAA
jgi:hypothetical protein